MTTLSPVTFGDTVTWLLHTAARTGVEVVSIKIRPISAEVIVAISRNADPDAMARYLEHVGMTEPPRITSDLGVWRCQLLGRRIAVYGPLRERRMTADEHREAIRAAWDALREARELGSRHGALAEDAHDRYLAAHAAARRDGFIPWRHFDDVWHVDEGRADQPAESAATDAG